VGRLEEVRSFTSVSLMTQVVLDDFSLFPAVVVEASFVDDVRVALEKRPMIQQPRSTTNLPDTDTTTCMDSSIFCSSSARFCSCRLAGRWYHLDLSTKSSRRPSSRHPTSDLASTLHG
jgi:hypothetical protein